MNDYDLQIALRVLDHVVGNHEWCEQPHRCDCCGSAGNSAHCSQNPGKPKCDGCQEFDLAVDLLERHGLQ